MLARDRLGLDDVHVVPQGVDLETFFPELAPRGDGRLRVGLLYHVEPWKGVADSLAAVRAASATRPVELVAFGLFERRGDLPADAELHLRPSRAELRRLYSSLDVFLCGSWSETGPMTVPEALACGAASSRPTSATSGIWTGNGGGALHRPAETAGRARPGARRGPRRPEGARARAQRGRELIQEFTWERTASAFERILEESRDRDGRRGRRPLRRSGPDGECVRSLEAAGVAAWSSTTAAARPGGSRSRNGGAPTRREPRLRRRQQRRVRRAFELRRSRSAQQRRDGGSPESSPSGRRGSRKTRRRDRGPARGRPVGRPQPTIEGGRRSRRAGLAVGRPPSHADRTRRSTP